MTKSRADRPRTNKAPPLPTGNFRSQFEDIGEAEDERLSVDISYDIIRQFSSQLYTNPRKAIEELVCNSYDAGATECHVSIPKDKTDPLVILDNGASMDADGLAELWFVARSPKAKESGERVDNGRLQIGKFGVGKLAAYALGKRLTHIATIDGTARLVSVSQDELKDGRSSPRFDVLKAKERDVRPIISSLLGKLPKPWEQRWKTWTIAIVEEVVESSFERALKIGHLRRMLSTALPVFREFVITLDGKPILEPKIPKKAISITVDVLSTDFRDN